MDYASLINAQKHLKRSIWLSSPRRSCSYSGQKSNSSLISRTSAGRNGLQPKSFFGTETRGKCAQPPFLKFLFRGQQTLLLKLLMFLSSADRQQWYQVIILCFFLCLLLLFFVIRIAQSKLEDEGCEDDVDNDINNRRMLSRFGVWLLVGVCNEPARCKSAERLGRLVSMTLSWIETASTLRRDYVGELLKRLTSQYVCRWLTQVRDSKLDVLCSCLSPNPPAYVKVGGYWDSVSSKVRQHMEGLHRLCCLVPHNLITPEVSGCDAIQLIVKWYMKCFI